MATTRGLERLIFFTDAITAIAITLLILPLVDGITDVGDTTIGEYFSEEWFRIVAFVISFAVIARLWLSHHSLFEHVRSYDPLLVGLNLFWAFTIVVLPLPTAMTDAFDPGPGVVAFYIGTMTLSSVTITTLAIYTRRHPALDLPENPVSDRLIRGSVLASCGFAVAFILGVTVPGLNYWSLFVLFLLAPIGAIIRRRAARETATSSERG